MVDIMNWDLCERDFIRKVEIDKERINSILNKARLRLERAKISIKIDVSLTVEDYYEVIKELLTAYLLKNGLRSKNHQCLISYFYKKNPDYEKEAYLISQMSFFRNRLNYYGEDIPKEFYEKNKIEFEHIIKILNKLIEDKND